MIEISSRVQHALRPQHALCVRQLKDAWGRGILSNWELTSGLCRHILASLEKGDICKEEAAELVGLVVDTKTSIDIVMLTMDGRHVGGAN